MARVRNGATALTVWTDLQRVHALVCEQLDAEFEAEAGIPAEWRAALLALALAPGGRLRLRTLADRAQCRRSQATRLVDRMERAGLVAREPFEDDRRGVCATLTRTGRALADRTAEALGASLGRQFASPLGREGLGQLGAALKTILAAHGRRRDGPAPARIWV